MRKYVSVFLIIVFVTLAYLLLMMVQPTINSVVVSANTTIGASSNWSDYPETQAVLEGFPFWIWFVPATIGGAAVVITLKKGDK